MLFLQLFAVFLIIGTVGFGGGYAMLALIETQVVVEQHWLSMEEFTNIVAISQATPGPIGINAATYCGYTVVLQAGYPTPVAIGGALISTLALMLPSLVLMIVIARVMAHYIHSPRVQNILRWLRPTVVGMLLASVLLMMNADNFATFSGNRHQWTISVAIFIATLVAVARIKMSPITTIALAAAAGLLLL